MVVSNRRLKDFLVSDELSEYVEKNPPAEGLRTLFTYSRPILLELEDVIDVSEATMTWDRNEPRSTLQNINLTAPKGSLIAIVGKVGSGKSSFLLSLLGKTIVFS